MTDSPVAVGSEVTHEKHGRGVIIDEVVQNTDGTHEVPVLFYYTGDAQIVPVVTLNPAAEVARSEISTGSSGMTITVDDGFFSFSVEPDGKGSGFDVTLRVGNTVIDSAHLDFSEFIEME
ncbi:hypothetical protein [Halovivax gelatinilyticus]|uniref:hypothetical protein n=1 Tax=Halovivax gelatinilyticus TaxID=2961597 RepID=UPI0020CA47D4|nr:hypothetical protein [Halovivax gelatinilyticus]